MLRDGHCVSQFLGGFIIGAFLVGLIVQLARGIANQQDPPIEPAVDTSDPTIREDESISDDTNSTESVYTPLRAFLDKNKTLHLS